ncbi:MAG: efflux RND transporter periplasmic adaptor subunit [Rikenellaceae bacterium]
MIKNIATIAFLAFLCSCGTSDKEKKEETMSKSEIKERVNLVDTINLQRGTFNKQITCNGKLRAVEISNLNFTSDGDISEIKVYNGTLVKKGELLAVLDTENARIALEKAKQDLEKSYMDLIDNVIGQGYEADTTKVPDLVLKNSKMSSGYNSSVYALEEAQRSLDGCYLYAPFAGRIGNMDSKKYEKPSGDQFCTIIDDTYFNVEFNLLEAELSEIAVGQNIDVSLFVDETRKYNGRITEINPVVDEEGQIKIRARLRNSDNKLIEGMNVKLIVERDIPNMFVVPKDAVVSRDGFFVVFRLIDGVAVWTYVDVMMSNIDSHVITGNAVKQTTISPNDVIITSGNLNLADGTKVKPRNKE